MADTILYNDSSSSNSLYMKPFSISDLERFSGIKAHTIRIWEQRYQLFNPQRTDGNTRRYTLNDLRLLLDIALLSKNGYRISMLATMTPQQLEQEVQSLTADEDGYKKALYRLIIYKYAAEIEKFEDLLDSCVLHWDIDITIERIIIPFLEKTELLSYNDSSCETHFAITAIRRKIILGIELAKSNVYSQQSALLFLPEGEHYDLMLLYISYILKHKGIRVLYLGTNVPFNNLKHIIEVKKPELLFTYIPHKNKFKLHGIIPFLSQQKNKIPLFVTTQETVLMNQNYADVKFISYKEVSLSLHEYIKALENATSNG